MTRKANEHEMRNRLRTCLQQAGYESIRMYDPDSYRERI